MLSSGSNSALSKKTEGMQGEAEVKISCFTLEKEEFGIKSDIKRFESNL